MADPSGKSKAVYSAHLFASAFFFAAFTILIFTWTTAFESFGASLKMRHLFRNVILVVANFVLIILVFVNTIVAALSQNLAEFFTRSWFMVFSIYGALVNSMFSLGVLWCICRTHKYSLIAQQYAPNTPLKYRLDRLLVLMAICSACFVLRLVMICIKAHLIHGKTTTFTDDNMIFSVGWFALSDFIPRGVPTFSFIGFMGIKGASGEEADGTTATSSGGSLAGSLADPLVDIGAPSLVAPAARDGDQPATHLRAPLLPTAAALSARQ
jgi:hypothetical protein